MPGSPWPARPRDGHAEACCSPTRPLCLTAARVPRCRKLHHPHARCDPAGVAEAPDASEGTAGASLLDHGRVVGEAPRAASPAPVAPPALREAPGRGPPAGCPVASALVGDGAAAAERHEGRLVRARRTPRDRTAGRASTSAHDRRTRTDPPRRAPRKPRRAPPATDGRPGRAFAAAPSARRSRPVRGCARSGRTPLPTLDACLAQGTAVPCPGTFTMVNNAVAGGGLPLALYAVRPRVAARPHPI